MKRHMRITIVALVLVVVAVASLIVVSIYTADKNKKSEEATADLTFFSFDTSDITEIDITSKDDEQYVFDTNDDGDWELSNRDDIVINTYYCNSMVSAVSYLSAVKKVADLNEENKETFGLDDPVTVVMRDKNNKEYTLYIGNPSSTNEYFYATTGDKKSIYTIDYDDGLLFYYTRDALKSTNLVLGWGSSDFAEISVKRDGKVAYTLEKDTGWYATEPIKYEANSTVVASNNSTLIDKSVNSFGDEDVTEDKYAEYGYENPYYELYLKNEDGDTITILVKDKIESFSTGEVEILYKELGQIAYVDTTALRLLDRDVTYYTVPNVFDGTVLTTKGIEMHLEDKYDTDFDLDYEYDSDSNTFTSITLNGKSLDIDDSDIGSAALTLINNVLSMSYEDIDEDAEPEGEPEETVTVTAEDGTEDVYEFILTSEDNKFYCIKNGEYTGFIIRRKAFSGTPGPVNLYDELEKLAK